jgi:hypothetical protein
MAKIETGGKWLVQVGKGRGSYTTRYTFTGNKIHNSRALLYYSSLNTHSGGKKRLINPDGKIVARVIT